MLLKRYSRGSSRYSAYVGARSASSDLAAGGFDRLALINAVQPERASLKRLPVQKTNQPTWCDGPILGSSFGDVCELKCCILAQCYAIDVVCHRDDSFSIEITGNCSLSESRRQPDDFNSARKTYAKNMLSTRATPNEMQSIR